MEQEARASDVKQLCLHRAHDGLQGMHMQRQGNPRVGQHKTEA